MQLGVFEGLLKQAMGLKVPIFFSGDIFHTPDGLSNELLNLVLPNLLELFRKYPVDFYAITGNHDAESFNTLSRRSNSYITLLANSIQRFHVIDFETVIVGDLAVHGVPYITMNQDYPEIIEGIKIVKGKFNILMNHADYRGQKDTNGVVIGRGENITNDMFDKFEMVWSGHVHKPGLLHNNTYSIGSPFQQRTSDMGGEFGYWTLKKKFRMQFHELRTPRFVYYEDRSEINNGIDYWIKKPKENLEQDPDLITLEDLKDRKQVIQQYMRFSHNRSRSEKLILTQLLAEIEV